MERRQSFPNLLVAGWRVSDRDVSFRCHADVVGTCGARSLAADLCARGTANVAAVAMGLEAEAPNAGKHIASWKTQLGGIDHIHLVYGYLVPAFVEA